MKKLLILAIAFLGMALGISAQNRSINFLEGKTFAEVKEIAKKENKMIFIDFYTTWCGPCKWMDKHVFTNDSVADFYNSHFINLKIDAQKGEGPELGNQYNVSAYPTFLFVASDEDMVHISFERKEVKNFIQLGQDALNPERQLSKIIRTFYKGERDPKFVAELLEDLSAANLKVQSGRISEDYLAKMKDEDLLNDTGWKIVRHVYSINSLSFQFILRNHTKLTAVHGDSLVNPIITASLSDAVWKSFQDTIVSVKKDSIAIHSALMRNNSSFKEISMLANLMLGYKDSAKFSEEASVIEKFCWHSPGLLTNFANDYLKKTDDKDRLMRVRKWAKRATEIWDIPYANDTYARLLFKTGDIDLAIQIEEKVVELASKFGQSPDGYKKTLEEFKRMK